MSIKSSYIVGKNSPYKTPNDAINALIADNAGLFFTEDQFILLEEGVYTSFNIPSGTISPTSLHRLYIGPVPGHKVVIDGLVDSNADGISIGSGNSYITIRDLEIRNFHIGIFFDISCDYSVVERCLIKNCVNTGVFFRLCDNVTIHNSIIFDGDFNAVFERCKNVALVNNTFFNSGRYTTGRSQIQANVIVRLGNDYGDGITDTGTSWISNNIFYSLNGDAIVLFSDDINLAAHRIDYCDIYVPNGNMIRVAKKQTNSFQYFINSIEDIKTRLLTGYNCISVDPGFIVPVQDQGYRFNLALLSSSQIKNSGESYNPSAPASMPVWIDYTAFIKDFEGSNRSASYSPAIGAYAADEDFNLLNEPDNIPNFAACAEDKFLKIADSISAEIWHPIIKSGFFFSEEKRYYLYAKKRCLKLKELTFAIFEVAKILSRKPTIYLSGKEVEEDNIDYYGNTIVLSLKDSDTVDNNSIIKVVGKTNYWESNRFIEREFTQNIRIKETTLKYFLNKPYYLDDGAPIVITDDTASLYEKEENTHPQFKLALNDKYLVPEIIFENDKNKIFNSDFYFVSNDKPLYFDSSAAVIKDSVSGLYPIKSDYFVSITGNSTTGYISQDVNISNESKISYVFTLYAAGDTSNALVDISQYNNIGTKIKQKLSYFSVDSDWNRYGCYIGFSGTDASQLNSFENIESFDIDPSAEMIRLKVGAINGTLNVSALQLERGYVASKYHKLPDLNNTTVEFESSESGFYELKNLVMTPCLNYNHNGFLTIPNSPASQFDDNAPSYATTLAEYRWEYGRSGVLPWARLTGRDKYTYVSSFNRERSFGEFMHTPISYTQSGIDIKVYPSFITCLQDKKTTFYVEAYDNIGNLLSYEPVNIQLYDVNGKYPGVLTCKEYSIPYVRDVSFTNKLDSAGRIYVEWSAPAYDDITQYVEVQSGGSGNFYFDTKYKISRENYGNISLYNASGTKLTLSETGLTSGTYEILKRDGYGYIVLNDYPVQDSVSAIYNSSILEETKYYTPKDSTFQVAYNNKLLRLDGSLTGYLDVSYNKRKAWTSSDYGRRVFIDRDIYNSISGARGLLAYDAEFILKASLNNNYFEEFTIVAQNPNK